MNKSVILLVVLLSVCLVGAHEGDLGDDSTAPVFNTASLAHDSAVEQVISEEEITQSTEILSEMLAGREKEGSYRIARGSGYVLNDGEIELIRGILVSATRIVDEEEQTKIAGVLYFGSVPFKMKLKTTENHSTTFTLLHEDEEAGTITLLETGHDRNNRLYEISYSLSHEGREYEGEGMFVTRYAKTKNTMYERSDGARPWWKFWASPR